MNTEVDAYEEFVQFHDNLMPTNYLEDHILEPLSIEIQN